MSLDLTASRYNDQPAATSDTTPSCTTNRRCHGTLTRFGASVADDCGADTGAIPAGTTVTSMIRDERNNVVRETRVITFAGGASPAAILSLSARRRAAAISINFGYVKDADTISFRQ